MTSLTLWAAILFALALLVLWFVIGLFLCAINNMGSGTRYKAPAWVWPSMGIGYLLSTAAMVYAIGGGL